jgi:hypothetical protein
VVEISVGFSFPHNIGFHSLHMLHKIIMPILCCVNMVVTDYICAKLHQWLICFSGESFPRLDQDPFTPVNADINDDRYTDEEQMSISTSTCSSYFK